MTRTLIVSGKVLAGYANNNMGSCFLLWPFCIYVGLQEYAFSIRFHVNRLFGRLLIIGPKAKSPLMNGGYHIGKWRILIRRS